MGRGFSRPELWTGFTAGFLDWRQIVFSLDLLMAAEKLKALLIDAWQALRLLWDLDKADWGILTWSQLNFLIRLRTKLDIPLLQRSPGVLILHLEDFFEVKWNWVFLNMFQ